MPLCSHPRLACLNANARGQLYTALLPALGTAGTTGLVEAVSFLLSDMVEHLSILGPTAADGGPAALGTSHLGTTSCARAALAVAQNPVCACCPHGSEPSLCGDFRLVFLDDVVLAERNRA